MLAGKVTGVFARIRLMWQAMRIGWHVYCSARELYVTGHKNVWVRTVVVPIDLDDDESEVLKWDESEDQPQLPQQEE